jgi:IrrE N-terminal-like domain
MDVPYLSASEIENQAALLLAEFNIGRGKKLIAPVPVEQLLEAHLKLSLDFDDLHTKLGIPMTGAEPEVFGALWVNSREVFVDQSLDPAENPQMEGRYRFTVSHEIGHWRLHRDYLASADHPDLFEESAKSGVVICRSSQAKKRVEWQADYFASCLLMPRALIFFWWRETFSRSNPLVFSSWIGDSAWTKPPVGWTSTAELSSDQRARFDPKAVAYFFYKASAPMAPIFNVSVQAMQLRLYELGLLRVESAYKGSLVA